MNIHALAALPQAPGIYLFKDTSNAIIYIGKAKSIRKRVQTYFNRHATDWKIQALLDEHNHIDHITTKTETEALLLEAQLIQEHQPKFNVLLKSGQPFVYLMVTKDAPPRLEVVRNKKRKGVYFGPFLHKARIRSAHNYLIRTFKLFLCNKKLANGCLDYHLDKCAGTCLTTFDQDAYLFRLQLAIDALKKNHKKMLRDLDRKIGQYAQKLSFEKAKQLHEYRENLETIFTTLDAHFSPKKYATDIFAATTKQYARFDAQTAEHLKDFLHLPAAPRTIDCFDISHFQSRSIVGSCVRFTDGKPDKNKFRRFKIKTLTQQNDYAALQEIVARRYASPPDVVKNVDGLFRTSTGSDLPDLILIDGGKGQLSAVQSLFPQAIFIALAKREETIFSDQFPQGIKLDIKTDVGQLLIALRDYAHHFAISYHRHRRSQAAS